jgi:energy coupling factor transporter S component ThiW
MKQTTNTKKLALAGVLTALAIVGSFLSFPVAGSKCAPVQHMVNIFAAVLLGPGWGVGIAFCASLLRNILGIGSLMAFPGSMIGALCCGLVYKKCKNLSKKRKNLNQV